MKALVLAAALAALSSTALAGAARDAQPQIDKQKTVAVVADAGRLAATGLTLNDAAPWAGALRSTPRSEAEVAAPQVEPGQLLVALCVLGLALWRPLARLLRRQEQQRRASALASTLGPQARG